MKQAKALQKTKVPYVYRANYPEEYLDGYIAKIVRKSGTLFERFQLGDFGGDHAKCIKAAKKVADVFDKAHPRLSRRERPRLRGVKKDGLPVGVFRIVRKLNGRTYPLIEATWSPKPNQTKHRRFNISKRRSEAEAIRLAIAARQQGLAQMAGYHG